MGGGMFRTLSKSWLHWIAFLLIALVAFTAVSFWTEGWVRGSVRDDFGICIEFVEEGTLYGGQPFCHHAPIFLYAITGIKKLLGIDALVPATTTLNILLNVFILTLLTLMVKHETGKEHFALTFLAYFLIPFPYALTNILVVAAAAFGMVGLWVLYDTQMRRRDLFAGICFALAIFTHPTILFFILAILLHYLCLHNQWMNWQRKTISLSLTKRLGIMLLPSVTLFILFQLWYPKFTYYVFLIATKLPTLSLWQTFAKLFLFSIPKLNYFNLTTYVVLGTAAYRFCRTRDVYSTIAFPGFLLGLLFVGRNILPVADLTYIRYFFFALCAFAVVFVRWVAMMEQRTRRIALLVSFALLLFIPQATRLSMPYVYVDTRALVERPLQFIPPQEGRVLVEDFSERDFLVRRGNAAGINPEQLDVIITSRNYFIDPQNVPGFQHYGLIKNMSYWERYAEEVHHAEYEEIFHQLARGEYSLIIVGPPHWERLQDMLRRVGTVRNNSQAVEYCPVHVPSFFYFERGDSAKTILLWFRDNAQCIAFAKDMDAYYTEHATAICRISPYIAAQIGEQQRLDNRTASMRQCTNGSIDLLDLHHTIITMFDSFPK